MEYVESCIQMGQFLVGIRESVEYGRGSEWSE